MNPVNIIQKKRNGEEITSHEIHFFIQKFVDEQIPDYQMAALAMAICFQGMTDVETTSLTQAMAASGDSLDPRHGLPTDTIVVDKHSSGGVGDKTTLVVAPIIAACGLPVGKMSGRGLGFTGGTLDKLESIAGWRADISDTQFQCQLREIGLVIAGQTARLAPADKKIYALRDVTATVDSLPLIASSIMSKKLAAGADAIVLDVKCGNGAFMQTEAAATALAEKMVAIGTHAGRQMSALITQMNQPLGDAVGNALEVKEAVMTLQGKGPADFTQLIEAIASEMLMLGTARGSETMPQSEAEERIADTIASGAAFEKFEAFVAAQGGDVEMIHQLDRLPTAPVTQTVTAQSSGYISQIDARKFGLAVVELGGGRQQKGDSIDHRVGAMLHNKVGDKIDAGSPLYTVHAASHSAADTFIQQVQNAYQLSETPVPNLPIVHKTIRD